MHAVLFPHGGLRVPAIFSASTPTLPKSAIYGREFADGISLYASEVGLLQSSESKIKCEENKRGRPRRKTSSDKTSKENDKLKEPPASNGETSRASGQKEIIDLFRRIHSSISKGGSSASKKRISKSPEENQTAQSVLGALQQSPKSKQIRGGKEAKAPPRRRDATENETNEVATLPGDLKPTRPMSNFVKRSPIPQPKEDTMKEVEEQSSTVIAEEVSEMQKLDNMKLPELKKLARAKGVKGYSKLKKGELLKLLKGALQSS